MAKRIDLKDVNIYYGNFHAVADVALSVPPRSVTAFIGPSGCGKSTVLRSLNRMHEVTPGARVEGSVLLDGEDIYGAGVDPVGVRRTIGMVFQRPNPFPTMSIKDNVTAGLRLQGMRGGKSLDETAERSLQGANLWNEVKDRLDKPGGGLSGGQQRLGAIGAPRGLDTHLGAGVHQLRCDRRVGLGEHHAPAGWRNWETMPSRTHLDVRPSHLDGQIPAHRLF